MKFTLLLKNRKSTTTSSWFFQRPYVKPNLEASKPAGDDTFLPKSLTSDDFQEWLASCRATSPSFQDRKIRIRISKK
ncbi:MAG: hypothetical protein IPF68_13030 [Bacteroidales bacterium]|nr:hypothetical protein [Bacteroidales bacterium]